MQSKPQENKNRKPAAASSRGFSLLELVVVMVVGLILTAMALPVLRSTSDAYKIRSATASVSGAIQSTRYQAIFRGFPFQIVFNTVNHTYQISNQPVAGGAFVAVGGAVPYDSGQVVMDVAAGFVFRPSGLVQAAGGANVMNLSYHGQTRRVTVSNNGNINVVTP